MFARLTRHTWILPSSRRSIVSSTSYAAAAKTDGHVVKSDDGHAKGGHTDHHHETHAYYNPSAKRALPEVAELMPLWEKYNDIFYGRERDHKNFPIVPIAENHPPVRMGFIPDAWFQFFYSKTGVTGPYVFGSSLLVFLLSKEIWVQEHKFFEFIGMSIVVYLIMTSKYGAQLKNFLNKETDVANEGKWDYPLARYKRKLREKINDAELKIWQSEALKYLQEGRKENVDLQLEAVYRQRLAEVYQSVKRRLDYQVDVENAQRRFQQQHMVNWIVSGVLKSITPQQEKDALSRCIVDLKNLASKARATS